MPTQTFLNLPLEKRDRILNAALDEFSHRNIEQAVLSNVARGAAVPRGSIYQYFPDPDDLYMFVVNTMRAERTRYASPAMELYKTSPFLDFFEDFYLRDSRFLLEHPKHLQVFKVMYSCSRGSARHLIHSIQSRYRDLFLIAIVYDQDHGRIRRDTDASILADLCTHFMTDVLIFQTLTENMPITEVESHLKGTVHIIRQGVECRPGRECNPADLDYDGAGVHQTRQC